MSAVARASLVLFAVSMVPVAAHSQTVDEIVAMNLQARGGVERLKAIKSVKITGTVTLQGREVPMTTWTKRPNLVRHEAQVQNQKIISAFDGTSMWTVNPMAGATEPQVVTGPQADMMKQDAEFDPALLDYKTKGHQVELVGTEAIKGTKVHHLRLTKKSGQVLHLYIDAASGLELRAVRPIDQNGMKGEVATEFSNYQQVDGLSMPFSMSESMNGMPGPQVKVQKIEFDVPVEDELFRMPAKK